MQGSPATQKILLIMPTLSILLILFKVLFSSLYRLIVVFLLKSEQFSRNSTKKRYNDGNDKIT